MANRRGKRRKRDPGDARDVALRLARGECPLGYIADDELMQLRKLGRHWRQLSTVQARAKQCMKSMLLAANLRGPKFDGASAQRWLLAHGHLLKPAQRRAFANFVHIVQLIELQRQPLRYAIIVAGRSGTLRPADEAPAERAGDRRNLELHHRRRNRPLRPLSQRRRPGVLGRT